MNNTIASDLYRLGGLKGFSGFLKGLRNPGFKYIYIVRQLSTCTKYSPKWMLFSLLNRHYSYKYGFQIPTQTKIGKGFYIGHFGTLIINKDVILGDNCNVAPNTTIGETTRGARKGSPTIGNRVWIGTGVVIVGKITIGSNVLIAPNTFLNVDVPDNSVVMGNPAQIISKENAVDGYIDFVL